VVVTLVQALKKSPALAKGRLERGTPKLDVLVAGGGRAARPTRPKDYLLDVRAYPDHPSFKKSPALAKGRLERGTPKLDVLVAGGAGRPSHGCRFGKCYFHHREHREHREKQKKFNHRFARMNTD